MGYGTRYRYREPSVAGVCLLSGGQLISMTLGGPGLIGCHFGYEGQPGTLYQSVKISKSSGNVYILYF